MKKILVVEDSPTILCLVIDLLEYNGYKVVSANDGETGLSKMKEAKPDLVVLDIRLPGMDGYQVCCIAKSDPELKNIPIIFLTTSAQKREIEKAKEVGADGYVTKPYEGKGLVEEIDKFFRNNK